MVMSSASTYKHTTREFEANYTSITMKATTPSNFNFSAPSCMVGNSSPLHCIGCAIVNSIMLHQCQTVPLKTTDPALKNMWAHTATSSFVSKAAGLAPCLVAATVTPYPIPMISKNSQIKALAKKKSAM